MKVRNSSIQAHELLIPGMSGLAVFSNKGYLSASAQLKVDDEGYLLITELKSNINMHQNTISNVSITHSKLIEAEQANINELYMKGQNINSFAVWEDGGKLGSTSSTMKVIGNTLLVESISSFMLMGTIAGNNQKINNIQIEGGSISQISKISTDTISITSLSGSDSPRMATIQSSGDISISKNNEIVEVGSIAATSINMKGNIDTNNKNILNVNDIKMQTGEIKKLLVTELIVMNNLPPGKALKSNDFKLLSTTSSGEVVSAPNIEILQDNTLKVHHVHIEKATVGDMILPSLSNTVLSVDSNGKIVKSDSVLLVGTTTSENLAVSGAASINKLQLSGIESSSVLSVDSSGAVFGTNQLSVSSVSSDNVRVSGNLATERLILGSTSTVGVPDGEGILVTNSAGEVRSTNKLQVKRLSADDMMIDKSLSVLGHLYVSNITTSLLYADESGKVTTTKVIVIPSTITDELTVIGKTILNTLNMVGMKNTLLITNHNGDVVSAESTVLDQLHIRNANISNIIVNNKLSLQGIPSLIPLALDDHGYVTAVTDMKLDSIILKNLSISQTLDVQSVRLPSLVSTSVLAVNSTGHLTPAIDIAVGNISAKHIIASESFKSHSIQLVDTPKGFIYADSNGQLNSTTSVAVTNVSTEYLNVSHLAKFQSIMLSDLPSALLSTDENGLISTTQSVSVHHTSSITVTAREGLIDTLRVKSVSPGLPIVTSDNGLLVSTQNLSLEALNVSGSIISKHLVTDSLNLGIRAPPLSSSLLSVDSSGSVFGTNELSVSSVSSDNVRVTGNLTAERLTLGVPDGEGILVTNSAGEVRCTNNIHLNSVSASDLILSGMIAAKGIRLASLLGSTLLGQQPILSVNSIGEIVESKNITLQNIETVDLHSSNLNISNNLILSSLTSSLLSTNEKGELIKTTAMNVHDIKANNLFIADKTVIQSLQLPALQSTVLYADSHGNIGSTKDMKLENIISNHIQIDGIASMGGIQLSHISPNTVLSTNSTGHIIGINELNLNRISALSMNVEVGVSTDSLQLRSLKSTLLSADDHGNVVRTDTIDVTKIHSEDLQVHNLLIDKTMKLINIKSSLLSTDENGLIVKTESSSFKNLDIHGSLNTSKLFVHDSIIVPGIAAVGAYPVLLAVDRTGQVIPLEEVQSKSLRTETIHTDAVVTDQFKIKAVTSAILGTDTEGWIVPVTSLTMKDISTNTIKVLDVAEMNQLKITGLIQSDVNSKTVVSVPLATDSIGNVIHTDSLILKKVNSEHMNTEKLHIGSSLSLDLTTMMKTPIDITHTPILTADRQGHVTAVSSVQLSSIATSTLKVSNVLDANSLQVNSFTYTPTVADPFKLVISESNGVLSTRKLSDLSIPLPQIIAISELKVSGSTTVHNLNIANSEAGILSIDSLGTVRSVQNMKLKAIESDLLSVSGSASIDKLILKGSITSSVLSTDSYGNVVPLPGMSLQDSNLRIRLVRIEQLNGDLDVNGHKIQKANLVGSTITDTDITLKGTIAADGTIITSNKVSNILNKDVIR